MGFPLPPSRFGGGSAERLKDECYGKQTHFEAFGVQVIRMGHRKDDDMTRLLAFTALALSMGIAPVLAADTSTQPPTANTTSPEASKSATTPPSGGADTSGGATEQSSSPPSAGSTEGKMGEQSSSPSSAPSTSGKMEQTTPNPTAPSSGD
jgi:hypothetical protein